MRILLVSQMYPGPDDPDLGTFVAQVEHALALRGHEVARAVLDTRAGGRARYATLAARTVREARSFRPDVVYAHFLVPAGLIAALSSRAPLVVTGHGQDVRNVGAIPGVAAATRYVVGRARTVIVVSDYLRRELEAKIPAARGKTEVIDSGVDLDRFPLLPAREPTADGPAYLCIGGLTERKNVVRLARAFERLARGTLTFAGDGPLRPQLEGRPGVQLLGSIPQQRIPELISASDVVCQPSLVEPFGQALLEALACGRPVVATNVGGPPEFVPPDAGVLVDPTDETKIADALRAAAELPCPNVAGRAAAERHDVKLQAERIEAVLERAAGAARSRGGPD
ncbi:MAG TPA: glycosyltransferase [Gaiellaceae bacterium]|nr:glycosyltransferase [Gaiellaceae bacterium]